MAAGVAGLSYHQSTRFNSNITINGTKVGGMTAEQALKTLKSTILKNVVYVGQEKIYDGKDTMMGFTDQDLSSVTKVLNSQHTFFPSSKAKNYSLMPNQEDHYRSQTMKKQVEEKLSSLNKNLTAPLDAEAHLEDGKITISKSKNGKQYDIAKLIKDYEQQEYKSEIHLNPVYIQPIKEDSPIVKKEVKLLQDLVQRSVDYQVQDQDYTLNASDLIKNASVSKDMTYTIDTSEIKNKISDINNSQSTLYKNFQFKTHTGSVVTVKGQTYGWAINITKESKRVKEAFEKGETSLPAKYVYGDGWSTYGNGYKNTTNNGIGNTYAEVSIQEQRIWLYKNGQLVLTTNVVTGKHSTNEDTPKGVWYIEYKESPSVLKGSEVGNPNYSVKVNYWAPFTLGGVGFHDASWRTNWKSDAYLEQGSGGCVNTPPGVMKSVYDNLSENEPVVVY
ncbi:L,D-transpeptidase family protein [Bacillus sp. BRMEA1]|uniref:L,D-transpeptidase family protein n=1 Tax=Neobacillus endophyticus TaxID=2738405 RepID=UPI0015660A6D|nr:L,D-transpeptidase family protein [Neobacillus endophyticus]NRD80074.1 L,D-transpeptidase family protein [Neobacillus endophyticus]